MRQYHDYKKSYKPFVKFTSALHLGIFLLVLLVFPIFFSSAQSVREIQNKIDEKDAEIEKLEREISAFQTELDSLGKQKDSLSRSIKELDLTKKKLNADISVTQNKIDKTNLKIKNLGSDIGNKEISIENHLKSLSLEIKKIHEFEQNSIVETILSNDNLGVVWNDIDNVITLQEKMRENIISLRQKKGELEDTRDVTIEAKNELVKLKSQLSDQQKIVVQNTNEKNKLLAQTKNNETNYQKLLQDRIIKRDAFEKELEDYEAQLKYILDPSTLPKSRVFSWPLKNVLVTQLFGKTSDSGRLYASGTHNGVDFRASTGTPVMAMADGKVVGVGDTDLTCYGASFGKFIFIEYDNGLSSTYGHLSLIKVKEGNKVKRGEIVGYSGNTGHSTGPHLHVSLYAPNSAKMASKASVACDGRTYRLPVSPVNAYLDVLAYLPPSYKMK